MSSSGTKASSSSGTNGSSSSACSSVLSFAAGGEVALPLMERSANGGVELPESRRLPEQSRTAVAEFRWGVDPAERAGEDVLIGFAGDAA
eukprot:CAMPEP_0206169982 /NCGR_PEP_ID=MMETSP1474-20131121/37482_1 /ASSEMBLY_ACC=CAM_ASM_001110 /TAXON_ID=97495 /ORGANISM="Imantonia sp., Strain RCC918" /LENGTH=89 /DNA_ID=CAMNT_0053576387 /DNA_START=55 /DNA_END=321 /DNA_ORIENTATION=-